MGQFSFKHQQRHIHKRWQQLHEDSLLHIDSDCFVLVFDT